MLNLKNTLDGYLKNVEVIGNTVQDENNLADIRSVGDKVDGQELYKIDVVSCNQRYLHEVTTSSDRVDFLFNEFLVNGITIVNKSDKPIRPILLSESGSYVADATINTDCSYVIPEGNKVKKITLYQHQGWSVSNDYVMDDIMSIEGAENHKLTILSPVQLEKVGDVADRIICKDGVWGVEKNIETIKFSEWDDIAKGNPSSDGFATYHIRNIKGLVTDTLIDMISTKLPVSTSPGNERMYKLSNANEVVCLVNSDINTVDKFREYMEGNLFKYVINSTFIPLPHDQRFKLRTFAGQTNIAFLTEIPGQIKAQVPKSLGATVNTHTEQIADLHNSLDRVKKLEETTVSTIGTESGFTTVDATNNGYFEDVKLEGKTLVNLVNYSKTLEATRWNHFIKTSDLNCMLKPNTEYTIVAYVQGLSDNKKFSLNCSDSYGLFKGTEIVNIGGNGVWVSKATTKSDFAGMVDVIYTSHNPSDNVGTYTISLCLLEGDHTNNPPEYFEGLMSVGQDVEKVSVESVNDNILDIRNAEMKLISSSENIPTNARILTDNEIYYKGKYGVFFNVYLPKGTFNIGFSKEVISGDNNSTTIRVYREGDLSKVLASGVNTTQLTSEGAKYSVCFYGSMGIEVECKLYNLYINACNVHHIEHQSNKKPLLYYNPTTETWEKPVLREWDTIEKHSDGKYYYHKRSGEVALNGSESWNVGAEQATTIRYQLSLNTIKPQSNLICDKFAQILGGTDSEGISNHFSSNMLQLTLNKDKGSVKQWLQANPTTVVYQLAQEEVYECTNIDLMTYSGETNYIINSGAISPKSLLKVHNNISNVVKILQEKVSLLENTFIAGLKSVLSGDMYSLATILYPEDFEQNDNTEQDIMVIPE